MSALNPLSRFGRIVGVIATTVLGCFGAASLQAAIIQLSFTGTYDTGGYTVCGLCGPAVPFNYSLTYDTARNTNPYHIASGVSLGGYLTTSDWYGYSASGITAASLTLGGTNWTVADLVPRVPAVGVSADLWFDTDLSLAPPGSCWAFFSEGDTSLELGVGMSNAQNILMLPDSSVFVSFPRPGNAFSSNLTIEAVPEPSLLAFLLLALSLVAPGLHTRRKA
jgi:hypothetical protein